MDIVFIILIIKIMNVISLKMNIKIKIFIYTEKISISDELLDEKCNKNISVSLTKWSQEYQLINDHLTF